MRFLRAAALCALAVAGAGALYSRLSYLSVINSDGANEALQGLDFWHGNVLLRDWWLAADTFYLTDAPLYGLIARLQGLGPWVVHEAAGLVYGLAVVVAALAARGGRSGPRGWASAGVAAAVLALPAPLLLQGQMHILGVVFMLLGLLWVDRRPGQTVPVIGAALLFTAAMGSDPLMAALFVPAIVLPAALRAWRLRSDRRRWTMVAGAAVVGGLATAALPKAVAILGGFTRPRPLHVGLTAPSDLPHHLGLAGQGLLYVFGADVLDTSQADLGSAVARLLAVGAVAAGIVLGLRRLRSVDDEDFLPQVLVLACLLDLAAFIFTTQAIDLASSRFLSPFAVCGAALAGRVLLTHLEVPRLRALAVAAAVLTVAALAFQLTRPPAPAPTAGLERWLLARNLTHGLGSYWEASIVTLDTSGRVTVRCADGPERPGGPAGPDRWFQDGRWFTPDPGRPADFVVFSPGEHTANITESGAIAAFGPPSEIDHVGAYEVLIYSRDLLADLAR